MDELQPGTPEWEEAQAEIINKAVAGLMEHFDTVQVFVTKQATHPGERGNLTYEASRGSGNWHARCNQVREFILKCERRVQLQAEDEYDHQRGEEDDE